MDSGFLKAQKVGRSLLTMDRNNLAPILRQRNNVGSSNRELGALTRKTKTRDEARRTKETERNQKPGKPHQAKIGNCTV